MESSNEVGITQFKMKKTLPCIELRFLIPSKVAGTIIGKSGENIRNLRRLYMAKINISDNPGPERIMSIEADLGLILDVLRQCLDKIEFPRSGGGDMAEYSNQIDLRMLVNQSLVGALIGRGGGRITELREKCDLRVLKVYQIVCPDSSDRIVQMIGSLSPVLDCVERVVELCKDTPVREPKINYDAQNYDSMTAQDYGGWSTNSGRQEISFVKGGGTSLGFSRPAGQCEPFEYNNYANNYSFGGSNRDSDASFNHTQYDGPELQSLSDFTQTIRLPHKTVGAIIGPGGSRITQIRQDSDAQITISSPDRGTQDRTVTMSGSLLNVRRAHDMINECIDKYGSK